jgi:hypothetical protein
VAGGWPAGGWLEEGPPPVVGEARAERRAASMRVAAAAPAHAEAAATLLARAAAAYRVSPTRAQDVDAMLHPARIVLQVVDKGLVALAREARGGGFA